MAAACAQAAPPSDAGAEQEFQYPVARRGCTQEDAPALELVLTAKPFSGLGDPAPPYLHFEISSTPRETIRAGTYALMPLRRDESKPIRIVRGALVQSNHDSDWLTGSITLDEVIPGQEVSGRYDVATNSGKHFSNKFLAVYVQRINVCG